MVLDESGSIGRGNFEVVRDFVLQYVRTLTIGPDDNQVGVITFASDPDLDFDLDDHSNRSSLEQAVNDIVYSGGGTDIPDALCELLMTFSSNTTGARLDGSVFRVAIFLTDGISGSGFNPCGFTNVPQAAAAVRDATPPILVFAVGVGSGFNQQDLIDIATGPEFVLEAASFAQADIECVQAAQEDSLCFSSKHRRVIFISWCPVNCVDQVASLLFMALESYAELHISGAPEIEALYKKCRGHPSNQDNLTDYKRVAGL